MRGVADNFKAAGNGDGGAVLAITASNTSSSPRISICSALQTSAPINPGGDNQRGTAEADDPTKTLGQSIGRRSREGRGTEPLCLKHAILYRYGFCAAFQRAQATEPGPLALPRTKRTAIPGRTRVSGNSSPDSR